MLPLEFNKYLQGSDLNPYIKLPESLSILPYKESLSLTNVASSLAFYVSNDNVTLFSYFGIFDT